MAYVFHTRGSLIGEKRNSLGVDMVTTIFFVYAYMPGASRRAAISRILYKLEYKLFSPPANFPLYV